VAVVVVLVALMPQPDQAVLRVVVQAHLADYFAHQILAPVPHSP
jgi:hypothetical protein